VRLLTWEKILPSWDLIPIYGRLRNAGTDGTYPIFPCTRAGGPSFALFAKGGGIQECRAHGILILSLRAALAARVARALGARRKSQSPESHSGLECGY